MKNKIIKIKKLSLGNNLPLTLIAGPCQIESKDHCHMIAAKIKEITNKLKIGLIFKSSFDKANRTSLKSKRGVGLEKSLSIFDFISKDLDIPILTDVHNEEQCKIVSEVVDVIQIPAFLCRQTDLLVAAAKTNKVINVKKGQSVAQGEVLGAVGMTGWATGPHLHFEFRVNGQHVDPLVVVSQSEAIPLPESEKGMFSAYSQKLLRELSLAAQYQMASAQ